MARPAGMGRENELDTYLREINEVALLSPGDELQLACEVQEGNMEAREHMILANIHLVVSIRKNSWNAGRPFMDAPQGGKT